MSTPNETFEQGVDYSIPDENTHLPINEWAQNVFNKNEFITIAWDTNKYRLAQRIKELMLLGYKPYGNLTSHLVYENRGSSVNIPVKNDLCLVMIHENMYRNIREEQL